MNKVITKNQIRKNRILRTLLEEGRLSLTDVAKRTGISLPMVSRLAAALREERLIVTGEGGKIDRAGRPPIVAQLDGDAGYVLGFDLGHRNTNIVLINLEQHIVVERHMESPLLGNDPEIVGWLAERIEESLVEAKVPRAKLLGIGLSIPGIVRGREGVSESYLNFGTRPLREVLAAEFKKPVHIEHDAKAMALGERWFGAAKNMNDVLCLNIGWGLGLGIIAEGRLYYGRDGYAGEFGHLQVVPNGLLCACGKRGCLETVASGKAIARVARERLLGGAPSRLLEKARVPALDVDAEQVVAAAMAGDQFSIEILEEAGRYLGEGIAKLINLFNPELIILGGRVSNAKHFILDPVRGTALKQSLTQLNRNVEFTISDLGTKSGALGVAMLAARDLFEVDHLNPTAFV
jgi:glucokinase-like ROK family protein